ncbi:hypothetical protein [Leptolyngbya sp. FACHB-261]|uniref:hypothetical protein n=1 Tax=Leptolyngbya sp. FACHB-261 TaxID=2692806 RepID=UPI001F555D84|nr:hypothetical protein [Leptolyngbya sp. FACHB-261]
MVKPFSPRELVARVQALLRRVLRQAGQAQIQRTAHFSVDLEQRAACRYQDDKNEPLELTTLEFDLLATLISQPGRVWSRT